MRLPRFRRRMARVGTVAFAVLVVSAANLLGYWWVSLLLGLAYGLLFPYMRAILLAALIGALSWAVPIALMALHAPVWRTAEVLATMAGFGRSGAIVILSLTVALGSLLGVSGAWLGLALRNVLGFPTVRFVAVLQTLPDVSRSRRYTPARPITLEAREEVPGLTQEAQQSGRN